MHYSILLSNTLRNGRGTILTAKGYKYFSQPTFRIGSIVLLLTHHLQKEMKLKPMMSNQTMHNVIKKVIPNNAKCYQRNQTK